MTHGPLPDLNAMSLGDLAAHLRATGLVDRLLRIAVDEDTDGRGLAGDVTAAAAGGDDGGTMARADLVSRGAGVAAGLAFAEDVMSTFGATVDVQPHIRDGDPIERGVRLATVSGPIDHVLTIERTLLNLVCRLTGVATQAARYVRAMGPPGRARLFDTRKTTPGLRVLEKYAVRCGGGMSHRLGLHDAVLIKDNHIAGVGVGELAAFVRDAAARARRAGPVRFVEVEVDSLDQLDALLALDAGVIDIVLLDNMGVSGLREACSRRDARRPRLELEASGGITLETIGEVARTGVDRISVGALTHSAVVVDIGLDFV